MNFKKIKAPNTYLIMFSILILTAILTWIIPGGEYETAIIDGKSVVVPGSFKYVSSNPQFIDDVLIAPLNGFIEAALIIGFVLVVGGSFYVLQHTEAIDSGIKALAEAHKSSRFIQIFIIPIFMIIFSLAGAVFGMSEELIPFVLLFIPLALALGYDTVIGVAIPFVGAGAGFAGAFINPFTLGIAQGLAELPPLSGIEYRLFCWLVTTSIAIIFVLYYAKKLKKSPKISITYKTDQEKKKNLHINSHEEFKGISKQHKFVLLTFLAGIIALVYGVLEHAWYIKEISALFLLLGIIVGVVGKLKINQISNAFLEGAKDLIGTGLIIALARGILVIAREGKIIDTILNSLSSMIGSFHPVISAQSMFVTQSLINLFVPSGSGQAALTMPIMAPLGDLVGVSRQTAVLAFQFGDGFSNMIIPTSAVTMGVLALAGIPWEKWVKWILPLEVIFVIAGLILLIPPYFINW